MAAEIDCPSCGRKLRLPDELMEKQVCCPSCGQTFEAALPPEAPVLPTDAGEARPESVQARKPRPSRLGRGRIGDQPCPYCGEPVPDDAARCRHCGEYLDEDEDDRPWEQPGAVRRDCEPHRGALVLTLGIISLVCAPLFICCGLISIVSLATGLPAWILGHKDLRKMREYSMDPAGSAMTQSGRICGMIGTILACLVLLLQIGMIAFMLLHP